MSLASQLAGIAASSGSTVLDRSKRQKIHSTSLIFEPKVAATQDYHSILSHSTTALDQLSQIHPRFAKFKDSLFSETSINIDRNVQTSDQARDLDSAINLYLSLIAPYWDSPLSFNATEWLVRRFYINIHNSESFLLSVLPYHNSPLFSRVVSIIPTLPPLFSWLSGIKKSGVKCTREGVIKGGFSNIQFTELYITYFQEQLSKSLCYQDQLVFAISSLAFSLSQNANNESYLDHISPLVLKLFAQLCGSKKADHQIAAQTLIVVLSATISLSSEVLSSVIDGCISCSNSKYTLITVHKLYQTLRSVPESMAPETLSQILKHIKREPEVFKDLVISDSSNKLFLAVFNELILAGSSKELQDCISLLQQITLSTSSRVSLIRQAIKASSNSSIEDKSDIIKIIEYLVGDDQSLFIATLNANNMSVEDLEMNLQSVLSIFKDKSAKNEESIELSAPISNSDEASAFKKSLSSLTIKKVSFLSFEQDHDFKKLAQLFITACKFQAEDSFLSKVNENLSLVSFLLRILVTVFCPIMVRIKALKFLLGAVEAHKTKSYLATLFPVILVLLSDHNKAIREASLEVMQLLKENAQLATKDKKMSESIFLKDTIFGEENASKSTVLSPSDFSNVLTILMENESALAADPTQIYKTFKNSVFTIKKTGGLVLACLAINSTITDIVYIKTYLMRLVKIGSETVKNSASSSFIYSEFLNEYLQKRQYWMSKCELSSFDSKTFESQILSLLNLKDSPVDSAKSSVITSLTFLQKALSSPFQQLVDLATEEMIKSFPSFKLDYQVALCQSIIESSSSDDSEIFYDPLLLLQSLDLNSEVFLKLFSNFQLYKNGNAHGDSNGEHIPKRRRRSSTNTRQAMKKTEVAKLAETHLKNVIILLETYEKVGKKIEPTSNLLVSLFNLLSDLETLGSDGNLPVVYAQECLANCLLISIRNSAKLQLKLDSNSIRADVLVSIIRASNSPQLQNKLLLVISELASLEPEFILHSIMPIFTFMGAYTVKQDDEYSSYVIEQTISNVIPALAIGTDTNQSEEVEFLLTSFTSAFNHIPRHRRVKLFSTLAKILGPTNSLHIVFLLFGKQYFMAKMKHKFGECKVVVDFVKSLMKNFNIQDQLSSIKEFLNLWSTLPNKALDPDSEEAKALKARPAIGPEIGDMTTTDLLIFKKNLISFMDRSIMNDTSNSHNLPYLKLQVATLLLDPRSSKKDIDDLLQVFNDIVAQLLAEITSERSVEEASNEVFVKISVKFQKLLNDVLSLLPINFFTEAVSSLISGPEENLSVKASVIFVISKQFDMENSSDEVAISSANNMCESLMNIVSGSLKSSPVSIEMVQNSLDTLSSMIDKFQNSIDSAILRSLLETLTAGSETSMISDLQRPEVLISSLNSVSHVVNVLGIKSIGFLSRILPPTLRVFDEANKRQKGTAVSEDNDEDNDEDVSYQLIETSAALTYSCFVKNMPQIVTPYLPKILTQLFNDNSIKKDVNLLILNNLLTHIESSQLFRALMNVWDSSEFQKSSSSAIGLYLNLLTQTIEILEKKDCVNSLAAFLKFIISSFDFIRNNDESIFNKNAISRIESMIFNCELHFIMKLNDKAFRPLFRAAVNWSFDTNSFKTEDEFRKVEIFLKFFNKLHENLKSVITSYYSYIIDYIFVLLKQFDSGAEEHIITVQRTVYISLNNSFRYDQEDYWSVNARFEKISSALADQLRFVDERVSKHLTKALASLAVKNSKVAEHNKHLSRLLIEHLKTECSVQEKYTAIKVLESIYIKIGASWLSLLPQLVPFIAELLEDDNEKVELEVRKGLVKVIEDVLGESLDKYLT